MQNLMIWIDYSDETKNEYMLRFSDFDINKECRLFSSDKAEIEKEVNKVVKRYKVKSCSLFDSTI